MAVKSGTGQLLSKVATGIEGFDEISLGGLPRNRTTLVMGGPGTGKSVFALQTLVGAARKRKQAGIFVAFEENIDAIFANAAAFDWGLPALARKRLFFMNAQLSPAFVAAGDFDLGGMLAMLEAKQLEIGAQWVVFDGIDVLLSLLRTPRARMREIYRLRDWLTRRDLTAIITTKIDGEGAERRRNQLRFHAVHGRLRGAVRPPHGTGNSGAPARDLQISRHGFRAWRISAELRSARHGSGLARSPPTFRRKPRPSVCRRASKDSIKCWAVACSVAAAR